MPSFARDTRSVGISKILIIVLSLAKSVIIARWLGPDANGVIAALAVYPSLFMTFGSLGIRQAVTFFVGCGKYTVEEVKTAVVQIWTLSTIVSVAACYLMITRLTSIGDNKWYVLLAIMPVPFTLFNTYNTGIFLGQNKIKQFSQVNWLPNGFSLATVVFLVVALEKGIEGALLAGSVGALCTSVILLLGFEFFSNFKMVLNWHLIKSLLRLGIVYAVALLIINLNYKVDVIMLDRLSSASELGIYSKGVNIVEYLWQIPMLFSSVVFARSANAKDKKLFSTKAVRLMQLSFIAVGIGCLGLAIFSDKIVKLLYGNEFARSSTVMQILLPGVAILTAFKVLNVDLAGRGKPMLALKAMLPALLINVLLNMFLIPAHGCFGASVASTVSYAFAGILFLFVYAKETGIPKYSLVTLEWATFEEFLFSLGLKKSH